MDYVLLLVLISEKLMEYFITVVDLLKHHCNTSNLNNCKWFQYKYKFVGMDMVAGETQPAHSQNDTFLI